MSATGRKPPYVMPGYEVPLLGTKQLLNKREFQKSEPMLTARSGTCILYIDVWLRPEKSRRLTSSSAICAIVVVSRGADGCRTTLAFSQRPDQQTRPNGSLPSRQRQLASTRMIQPDRAEPRHAGTAIRTYSSPPELAIYTPCRSRKHR